jgi:hypothetical protein
MVGSGLAQAPLGQDTPQAELSLNILRGSCINPTLSARELLHGHCDFNAHPPGIKVLTHVKPHQRKTWTPHDAVEAWYVGPAMDHYRCYTVWVIATRQTRIVNSLHWFPQKILIPIATKQDLA